MPDTHQEDSCDFCIYVIVEKDVTYLGEFYCLAAPEELSSALFTKQVGI